MMLLRCEGNPKSLHTCGLLTGFTSRITVERLSKVTVESAQSMLIAGSLKVTDTKVK